MSSAEVQGQPAARPVELGADLYREIFSHSREAIAIIDPNGVYLQQNGAHFTLLGYSDDDLEGHFTSQSMQQTPREEKWGYAQEDRAFIDSIVNGSPALVTAFDGLMSVEIANAVYDSVRLGGPVKIRS